MIWNALILGFLGSSHCVLMCGPLVMAIPGQKSLNSFILSRLIYNTGRIMIYTLLGALIGLMGQSFSLAAYQQAISIVMGIIICSMAFAFIAQRIEGKIARMVLRMSQPLKKLISGHFKKTSLKASLFSGMLNGLLPCGLVYVALASAMGTFSMRDGGFYMLIFGLGTFPAMLIMSLIGRLSVTPFLHKISAIYVFLLGILLILRGANLDIPYVSPALGFLYPEMGDPVICD